jgi:hypothetical protein
MVGAERFELPTLWTQTRCASQTALRSDTSHKCKYHYKNSLKILIIFFLTFKFFSFFLYYDFFYFSNDAINAFLLKRQSLLVNPQGLLAIVTQQDMPWLVRV